MSTGGTDLYKMAEEMGARIIYRDFAEHDGIWMPELSAIYLQRGLHPIHERCVLAHELGHIAFGHTHSDTAKNENQADRFAAKLLINKTALERLTGISPDVAVLAFELGVTAELLSSFLQHQLI
jgi:Zn-dependent peptidase ImmA (M78 family)